MLGDLNPRNIRRDGTKLSPDLRGGIHLQIKQILMGRATRQKNHYD
jgi:hypothetical protein